MRPCRKCGGTDRNASGSCRPCRAAASARYYAANKSHILERNAEYNLTHKENRAAYNKTYGSKHKEEIRSRRSAHYESNKEDILVQNRARKEQMASSPHKCTMKGCLVVVATRSLVCPAHARINHLKSKYGITVEQYDALLAAQGGHCALFEVCGSSEPGGRSGRWHVDHDHETGKVRGLLCDVCNRHRVGCNTLESAKALVKYLENI